MKKILLSGVGLMALGASAAPSFAADLAARPIYSKAPVAVASVYDWSGFYVGANGGWGSSHKCWDFRGTVAAPTPAVAEGCHDSTGAVAGGQIGYNWQAAAWVFGIEAQGDWANLRGSNVSVAFPAITNQSQIDTLGLFTARVGYAWNNVLLYVKGGGAVVHDKYDYRATGAAVPLSTASETRWGGAVGAGLEFGFAPNWSAGVEYDHAFLGRKDVGFSTTSLESIRQDVDQVTVRVNYRWGGPVVAKY